MAADAPFVAHGFIWLTVGLMDPPAREKLGYRWTGPMPGCTAASGRR